MREQQVRVLEREIEGQRLAAGLDVDLVAARQRRRAFLVIGQAAVRLGLVVHRKHGGDECRSPRRRRHALHEFRRRARPRGHHEDALAGFAKHCRHRADLVVARYGGRHGQPAVAAVVGGERGREADRACGHGGTHFGAQLLELRGGRLPVRGGGFAHHRGPDGGVLREYADVGIGPRATQQLHVFGERFELPAGAGLQRVEVHPFDHGQVLHHRVAFVGRARRNAEAAVAHHGGGDAERWRRRKRRVPRHLCVEMRMQVDDAGHQREAACIEGLARRNDRADLHDAPVFHPDICHPARRAQPVVNGGATNDQVQAHSGFTPASRATFCQRAISCFT